MVKAVEEQIRRLEGGVGLEQICDLVHAGHVDADSQQEDAAVEEARTESARPDHLKEKEDLRPWLNPQVPGPNTGLILADGDGWNRIDSLGAWECGLSSFRALENVPTQGEVGQGQDHHT